MISRTGRRLVSWLLAAAVAFGASGSVWSEGIEDSSGDVLSVEENPDLSGEAMIAQDPDVPFPEESLPSDQTIQTESIEELFGELETDTESSLPDMIQEETQAKTYPQLTADDIVRLDNGDAELIYDEEGRVTFIRGRYSPEKVTNHEEAAESLNYVSTLLGLDNGALLFCVYQGIDYTTGYTCYLFLQRDGDVTVVNSSIKIYVDPDGYTAALSCSFNPATGIREETAGSIGAEDAERIVRQTFPNQMFTIFSDATGRAGIMENEQNIRVWSVFTNNPDMSSGSSDLPFLQHFVSYSGQYLMNLPCSTTKAPLLEKDDALERRAKAMFEGYDRETWTGQVTLHDGKRMDLTVPVARSREDGRYYLMDLDRMMLVADYREAFYGSGELVISSSETNSGWKDKELIAMYNIGRAYDYFADHGYRSVDGIGIPLAILSGVSEADGTAIDNAFFSGFMDGFGVFAISDINDTVECLDIMGHEFAHGITSYSMGGSSYVNDLGAINEAFSDILGNLCELTWALNDLSIAMGKTTGQFEITGVSPYGSGRDPNPTYPDWRIGEMGGRVYRDMSNPVTCRQPAFVGDAYYCLPARELSGTSNDYGGVHENSSLLGSIAWVLNEHGLTFEKQYSLWMTAMNMMTPKSDYDDVLQAMIFARKSYGWDEEIDTWLEEAFAERGLLENCHSYSKKWDGVTFRQYNADYLKVLDQNKEARTDTVTGLLDSLLTGGGTNSLTDSLPAGGGTDSLTDSLPAGGGTDSVTDSPPVSGGTDSLTDRSGSFLTDSSPDAVTEAGTDPSVEEKSSWLAGVGLDEQGRIAREGFGRIELDTSPEDRQIISGAAVLEPYTYATVSINCPDRNGHLSFLLPEGIYWVSLCVSKGGSNQEQLWPYTKARIYEPWNGLTVFGEVEVKAGQSTLLPMGDVS